MPAWAKFIIGTISVAAAFVLLPWAITTLWAWFIVPGFGMAPISFETAFGLSLLVKVLNGFSREQSIYELVEKDDDKRFWTSMLTPIIYPLAVAFGALVCWVY